LPVRRIPEQIGVSLVRLDVVQVLGRRAAHRAELIFSYESISCFPESRHSVPSAIIRRSSAAVLGPVCLAICAAGQRSAPRPRTRPHCLYCHRLPSFAQKGPPHPGSP
jgi:hypothetical protein